MRKAKKGRYPKIKLKEQIVELYNKGLSDQDIAIKLGIPRTTVNYHRNTAEEFSPGEVLDKETTK